VCDTAVKKGSRFCSKIVFEVALNTSVSVFSFGQTLFIPCHCGLLHAISILQITILQN
jgi:hypothetical protein